ncbi:MAG TPA: alpha-amylase family glycosyl hydrolase [Gemmatimonadaceae bacterium]|nr:alpha-amylase family glycosyl hydrolase [Gemmatimonadaceae bacterium]
MRLALARALAVLVLASSLASAQAPVFEKADPPNWWAGHSINPVRVLVRGRHLAGARSQCARVTCGAPKVNAAGTYAFVDVTIPGGTTPGAYPLVLRTSGGTVSVPFTVSAPLARAGRFQGFGNDDVVYSLMPDRFANGDTTNDRPPRSPSLIDRTRGRYYHGGDIAGIRQRLPYLRSLGITAIWLNPLYDNNDNLNERETYDGQPVTDYHGYGATDFYAVDEHLGTMAEFRQLVDDAHRAGIRIILDMVANHTGPYHAWVKDSPTSTWYHGTEATHLANTWQTWTLADPHSMPEMREATLDGWFGGFLPDLNQSDPEVARYINQNTLWWLGMSGIDGIRQDTWPYVPRTFWRAWMSAIKREYPSVKVVGEVLEGDASLIAFFDGRHRAWDGVQTGVDALFDYPLFYPIRRAFGEGKPLREVAMMLGRDHLYGDPSSLMTIIGTHDVSRFMNERGATTDGLKLAYTLLLTMRGTPLIYYGDEIAMPGGNDPDNRRDFPGGWRGDTRTAFDASGRTQAEQSVWSHVQRLLQLRASRPDLRRGRLEHVYVSDQAFVYRRGRSVVALNNDTAAVMVRLPGVSLGADALGICQRPTTDGAATVVTIPARSGCIF